MLPSALTSDDIENVDIRDIPELEAKNEPKKRQIDNLMDLVPKMSNNKEPPKGTELKILTPNQLLKILPILLAQKQAGNNIK